MIGTIDIKINAAKPNFPISPLYAFIGSPSQVRVVNVPKQIGNWKITSVQVTANYPDNQSASVECVLDGGCWHGTLGESTSTGSAVNGFAVTASGVKEDGTTAVTGYVLGKGDVYIIDTDSTITVGTTTYYAHLVDTAPTAPKKGDLCVIDGVWKIYTGTAWSALGSGGGGDMYHSEFADLPQQDLDADEATFTQVVSLMNSMKNKLRGTSAALIAILSITAFSAVDVQTAKLNTIPGKTMVVTNVVGAVDESQVRTIVNEVKNNYVKGANVENDTLSLTKIENGVESTITFAGGSGPGGGTSPATVTNISTYVATKIAPVKYAWSSPDEWMIRFTPGSTTTSEVTSRGYTEGMMIMSNEVTRSVFQRNATASAVLVDESSVSDPVVTNWASSVGSTITSNGVVTADADGSYRVAARSSNGDIRYGDVILQSGTVTYSTNIYHAADVDGSGTKAANDDAVTKLLAATKVGDFIRDGQNYAVYNAQKVYITSVGAGNVSPFAVSQHILGTAAHYTYRPIGAQTFTDALGNTATVNKLRWVNLRDWARENGWSDAEIKDAGVDDIAFVICDQNIAIPDGCIPYFISPTAAQRYADGKGVQAWQCSQFHEWAMPVTLTAWNSALVSCGDNAAIYTRADALARLGAMGKVNFCTSGDSGKPYFIVDGEGRTIVTFANTQRYRGANWVKGYAIIKAFVEANGDTLKEVH